MLGNRGWTLLELVLGAAIVLSVLFWVSIIAIGIHFTIKYW